MPWSKIKAILLIAPIILIIWASVHFQLSEQILDKIIHVYLTPDQVPVIAAISYIFLYIVATLLFLPGFAATIFAGAYFGPFLGSIYTVIGATIGAMIVFSLVKILGREFIVQLLARKLPALYRYDQALKKQGFVTVLTLRLIPLFPFSGLNYALGLTAVKFRDYFLATFIGIIPGTILYSHLGSSVANLSLTNSVISIGFIVALILLANYYHKHNFNEK
jgi:uncharacterized membrane protein YdjX (TVP38/TMEM64 family)